MRSQRKDVLTIQADIRCVVDNIGRTTACFDRTDMDVLAPGRYVLVQTAQ